jgi:hypothetical protein
MLPYKLLNIERLEPAVKYLSTGLANSPFSAVGKGNFVPQHWAVTHLFVVFFDTHSCIFSTILSIVKGAPPS